MMKTFRKMTLTGALLAVLTSVFTPLHAQAEETSIRVMTYNACRGGTYQGQPLSQSAKMIELAQADIVGLQEIGRMYPSWQNYWVGIISGPFLTRYEIVEQVKGMGKRPWDGIKVKLPSGQHVLCLQRSPSQPSQSGLPINGP